MHFIFDDREKSGCGDHQGNERRPIENVARGAGKAEMDGRIHNQPGHYRPQTVKGGFNPIVRMNSIKKRGDQNDHNEGRKYNSDRCDNGTRPAGDLKTDERRTVGCDRARGHAG